MGPARSHAGLTAWLHLPRNLPARAPLVVALHGCTQNAASYALGSGWWQIAEANNFALLLPEQSDRNNPGLCLRWYDSAQTKREHGEVAAIAAMIHEALARHNLDPARVYITGLSAGGAMTMAMLACYPELFAAAAPLAAVPFAAATDMSTGLAAMAGRNLPTAAELTTAHRAAGPVSARSLPLSIWHGLADDRVVPACSHAIADVWTHLGWPVETNYIPELGHAQPIGPHGVPGPYFLPGFTDSTQEIARFFGILKK